MQDIWPTLTHLPDQYYTLVNKYPPRRVFIVNRQLRPNSLKNLDLTLNLKYTIIMS
jgi:hypothetical protein